MYYCKCWHTSVGADLDDSPWFWFGAKSINSLREYLIRHFHNSPANLSFGKKKGSIYGKEFYYFRNPMVIYDAKHESIKNDVGVFYVSLNKAEWHSRSGNRYFVNRDGSLGTRMV